MSLSGRPGRVQGLRRDAWLRRRGLHSRWPAESHTPAPGGLAVTGSVHSEAVFFPLLLGRATSKPDCGQFSATGRNCRMACCSLRKIVKITVAFLLIPVDCVSLNPCAGTCELEEMICVGGSSRQVGRAPACDGTAVRGSVRSVTVLSFWSLNRWLGRCVSFKSILKVLENSVPLGGTGDVTRPVREPSSLLAVEGEMSSYPVSYVPLPKL